MYLGNITTIKNKSPGNEDVVPAGARDIATHAYSFRYSVSGLAIWAESKSEHQDL
jgi:hypothetical protein